MFGPSAPQVQAVITSLKQAFFLKGKGEIKDFLGSHIHCDPTTQTITLTLPGLIDSVLTDLGFLTTLMATKFKTDVHQLLPYFTQTTMVPPNKKTWHYPSVIGKLNFIAANTHPGLSFTIHQCAKFSNQSLCLHEKAVKHIGQDLHLT